jgi:hypothetical protein
MMAKRKTISINPLDTLVPDAMRHQTGESLATAKTRSPDPVSAITRAATPRSETGNKDSTALSPAAQIAEPSSPADIFSRIQSLEKENEYIKWLAVGAILLAIFL